jgi:hypothetical protein
VGASREKKKNKWWILGTLITRKEKERKKMHVELALLRRCGNINAWKRFPPPSLKWLKNFGQSPPLPRAKFGKPTLPNGYLKSQNKTCAPLSPLYSTPAMNTAPLSKREKFALRTSKASGLPNGFGPRLVNPAPYVCQCASCKVERELGLSLRTPKQCEA